MAIRTIVALLLAAAISAAPGSARMIDPPPAAAERPQSSTGLICAWAMFRTYAEVGRRCPVTANPGLQGELEDSVSRLEAHARERSPEAWAMMETYRQRHIVGKTDARLCAGTTVRDYNELATGEPEALRDETDRLISLPGPPEWGDCV
jgi:hypothetical protein